MAKMRYCIVHLLFHFHPEYRDYSVRLMTRETHVSDAAFAHFFILLNEIGFDGQLAIFKEHCFRHDEINE